MKTEDQGPLEGEPEPESRIARAARKAMRAVSGKSPESQIAESGRKAMERHIIDERARNKAQMRIDSGRAITEGGDPLSSKPLVPSDLSASGSNPEAVGIDRDAAIDAWVAEIVKSGRKTIEVPIPYVLLDVPRRIADTWRTKEACHERIHPVPAAVSQRRSCLRPRRGTHLA